MDQKEEDLKYLQEMSKEALHRVLVKGELEQITEAFRYIVDGLEAVKDKFNQIAEKQRTVHDSSEDVRFNYIIMQRRTFVEQKNFETAAELTGRIVSHQFYRYEDRNKEVDLLGLGKLAHEVVKNAKKFGYGNFGDDAIKVEAGIAARLIDEERFHEFQILKKEGFDPKDQTARLMDYVSTLSGAKYLDFNGLIPDNYFKEYDKEHFEEPPLLMASDEQIDFYIAHGADVNAKDYEDNSVFDSMLFPARSIEVIEKVYNAGGRPSDSNIDWLIDTIMDAGDYYETKSGGKANDLQAYYGKDITKNCLDAVAFILEKGIAPKPKNLEALFSHPEWFEQYPDTMKKIFSEGIDVQKKLEEVKFRVNLKEQNKDLLQEKQKEIEFHSRDGGRRIRRRNEFGEQIDEEFLDRAKMHTGETGNSRTGKISDEQRRVGKNQAETAYKFMKEHREETRK